MADERLTQMLFRLIWPPTSREAVRLELLGQLTELQGLRGTALTEEEWADWRATLLEGLADNRHPEPVLVAVAAGLGLAVLVGLVFAWRAGATALAVGLGAGVLAAALLCLRLGLALAAKRRATPAERLALVEELLGRGLVTADEATDLRARIERLGKR